MIISVSTMPRKPVIATLQCDTTIAADTHFRDCCSAECPVVSDARRAATSPATGQAVCLADSAMLPAPHLNPTPARAPAVPVLSLGRPIEAQVLVGVFLLTCITTAVGDVDTGSRTSSRQGSIVNASVASVGFVHVLGV